MRTDWPVAVAAAGIVVLQVHRVQGAGLLKSVDAFVPI